MTNSDDFEARLTALEAKLISVTAQQESKTKLQLWLSFLKFVLGTVIVGILTVVLNNQIQNTELNIKAEDQEQNYVSQFLEQAMEENIEKRDRFALYFAKVLQGKWRCYYGKVHEEFLLQKDKLEKTEDKLKTAEVLNEELKIQLKAAINSKDEAKIISVQSQLIQNEVELKHLGAKVTQIMTDVNPMPPRSAQHQIDGRIYLNVPSDQQTTANPILLELSSRGYVVRVTTKTKASGRLSKTTIGYYYEEDELEAKWLADLLSSLGANQVQTPHRVKGAARPRHFDVSISFK